MTWRPLFLVFLTSLLVLSFGSFIVWPAAAQVCIGVAVSQAKSMIDMNPSLVILDARNQSGL
jgi:hypothetical protein